MNIKSILSLVELYSSIVNSSLSAYAKLASPTFTGTPKSVTPATGDNTTQIATTAFVKAQSYLTTGAATTTYAPLVSPIFTGTPESVTPATDDNTTKIATTKFVKAQSYLTTGAATTTYAPLASPAFTGMPTIKEGTFNNVIATQEWVGLEGFALNSSLSAYAKLSATNKFRALNDFNSGLKITGGTRAEGVFYTGDTVPNDTTRLNYSGHFYATQFEGLIDCGTWS